MKPSASQPSAPKLPPGPVRWNTVSTPKGSPVRGSTPLVEVHMYLFQPAVTRSGSASDSAVKIDSTTSSDIWFP